jgi:hypothetical protein
MLNLWQRETLAALNRMAASHGTRMIRRARILQEELPAIVAATRSRGKTPEQTLSRTLQELRTLGLLHHIGRGIDLLLDSPIAAEAEDYPPNALDIAITCDRFTIGDVETGDGVRQARMRLGQARLRINTLEIYGHCCGLCDVNNRDLLIASHIVRWSDDREARGRLSNLLCLCRMHDTLFEFGYICLSDDYQVLVGRKTRSEVVGYLQRTAIRLRMPTSHIPEVSYLQLHRTRTGRRDQS